MTGPVDARGPARSGIRSTPTRAARSSVPRGARAWLLLSGLALSFHVPALTAQDIEVEASVRGVPLPAGYYEAIRAEPDLFELPDAGWARRGRGIRGLDGPLAAMGPIARNPAGEADGLAGALPLIVIPALFSDSPVPHISRQDIDDALFGGPATENLTGFYLEASGGRLLVTGAVAPWVRTSLTLAETVGSSDGLGSDARTGEFLVEALELADDFVDFRLYDNDGPDGVPDSGDDDGIVDAVAFEFLEIGASCGGPGIWPHRSSIRGRTGSRYDSQDTGADGSPIQVSGYIVQGATECDGIVVQAPNVIAHELGHVLGLPDIYHPVDSLEPEGRRWVIGCWGLMAGGSWGCGDPTEKTPGYGPIHLSPWSRYQLGWIEYIDVGVVVDEEFLLPPSIASERALRIPLRTGSDEALVLEYRPAIGFDSELPAGGVLAYRDNPAGLRRPGRDSGIPYRVHLLEADGGGNLLLTLPEGGNRGEASDAFAVDGAVARLSNLTVPNLLLTDGTPSTLSIHDLRVDGPAARVRLTTNALPRMVEQGVSIGAAALAEVRESFTVRGGALPYAVELNDGALPEGLTAHMDLEELVISGVARQSGVFEPSLRVLDARGWTFTVPIPVAVSELPLSSAEVAAAILGASGGLGSDHADFLDRSGNGNARLDIGDLRALRMRGGG